MAHPAKKKIAIVRGLRELVPAGLAVLLAASAARAATRVEVVNGKLLVDGQPCFFIGLNPGPPVDLKTPEGGDGWAELAEAGVRAVRGGPSPGPTGYGRAGGQGRGWDAAAEDRLAQYLDVAAAHGIGVSPMLSELVELRGPQAAARREHLARFVNRFKSHPGLFFWKSADEPEWGKIPVGPLREAYELIHRLDPHHAVWFCHAPRGTLETLRPYNAACDALSIDIYPVSEPPGKHSLEANKGLSMVGDYTRRVAELAGSEKMKFMVLQGGGWSGVVGPKNRRMAPTPRQERYMLYQAIINGADSAAFFGMTVGLSGRDAELGWNWSWWRAVLRPLLAEIKPGSELYPALAAPDSKFRLQFTGGPQIEARCKEAGKYLYIFAAAREGQPVDARFSGPRHADAAVRIAEAAASRPGEAGAQAGGAGLQDGELVVLFENRTLTAADGAFTDHFEPHDVHVYRVLRMPDKNENVRK